MNNGCASAAGAWYDIMYSRKDVRRTPWRWGCTSVAGLHPARAILLLFVREHNYVCDKLAEKYPKKFQEDEIIFQQARLIITGVWASVILEVRCRTLFLVAWGSHSTAMPCLTTTEVAIACIMNHTILCAMQRRRFSKIIHICWVSHDRICTFWKSPPTCTQERHVCASATTSACFNRDTAVASLVGVAFCLRKPSFRARAGRKWKIRLALHLRLSSSTCTNGTFCWFFMNACTYCCVGLLKPVVNVLVTGYTEKDVVQWEPTVTWVRDFACTHSTMRIT